MDEMAEKLPQTIEDRQSFIGYHGTSRESAESILTSNFLPSENHDDWLGSGVYFFIEGILCPKSNAEHWAICQARDNKTGRNRYKNYSVIKVSLNVSKDKILDLSTNEGLNKFNTLRDFLIKKYADNFEKGRNVFEDDKKICDMTINLLKLEALINNYYIKHKEHRIKQIQSKIANSKVILIAESEKCIDVSSIKIIKTGAVS